MKSLKKLATSHKSKDTETLLGFTQDLVPIKEIENGFVITTSGDIVKIIEIESCDYKNSTLVERNRILSAFTSIFECQPDNIHFKSCIKEQNANQLLKNIDSIETNSQFYIERKNDYLDIAKKMTTQLSIKRVYYLIFKLEGEKNKDNLVNYDLMYKRIVEFVNIIESIGCTVNEDSLNNNDYIVSLFYSFLNPKTSKTETVGERNSRIVLDYETWNLNNPDEIKIPSIADLVAPKGIDFTKRTDAYIIDGLYTSYLIVKGNSFSNPMFAGWLDVMTQKYDVDYDIYSFRRSSEEVLRDMKQSEKIKHISTNPNDENSTDTTKIEDTYGYYGTLNDIRRCLAEKQHLFNVTLIFTFRNTSLKALIDQKDRFKSEFKQNPYFLDFRDCYCNLQELYSATLPLMEYKSSSNLFKLDNRNFVTSSFRALMPFSTKEFTDDTGIIIGQNALTQGMVSFNVFNKAMGFQNYNIAMIGETGSGKTYAEMLICTRANLTGRKTLFICPIKGDEYQWICKCSHGTFINLLPMGDSINIFEIYPEDETGNTVKTSLLSQKITQVLTFLRLLYPQITVAQEGKLNVALIKVYTSKGFDRNDNKSIFKSDGTKRESPIFSDLYEEIKNEESLSDIEEIIRTYFIEGSYSNLNAQTNADLAKNCIAVNCDEEIVGKKMTPCIMYLAFTTLYGIVKNNRLRQDFLIIDECWKFLNDNHEDGTGDQLLSCAKTIRSYSGSLFLATQSINDYFGNEYGKKILDCCETKILKRLNGSNQKKESHVYTVCDALGLSVEEFADTLVSLDDKYGLMVTPKQNLYVSFISSYFEKFLFGTDTMTSTARKYMIDNRGWSTKTFNVTEDNLKELYSKGIIDENWLNIE